MPVDGRAVIDRFGGRGGEAFPNGWCRPRTTTKAPTCFDFIVLLMWQGDRPSEHSCLTAGSLLPWIVRENRDAVEKGLT